MNSLVSLYTKIFREPLVFCGELIAQSFPVKNLIIEKENYKRLMTD